MSLHDDIKSILAELIVGGEEIPARPLRYRGDAMRYITWTITSEDPETSADDGCIVSVAELDVDIYSDVDYLDIMEAVISRFTAAGWVWAGSGPEMYEEDTGLYHRTVEFEIERMR